MKGWTLVTGGARHLGAEICRKLAGDGYPLIIHYNKSQGSAQQVADECRAFGVDVETIQGDFSTPELTDDFIRRYLKHFPNTENLINNVGNYMIKKFTETSATEWREIYQTNLFAPCTLMQALTGGIKAYKGSIINIGVVGITAVPADTYATAYTSTKLALWMATKSLAKELAPLRVRVNMVSPGYLETSVDKPNDLSRIPMHRLGHSSEIARVVSFLLDRENSYITGQNIEIAGGVRL